MSRGRWPGTRTSARDFDRNKSFYQAVFGYEYGDIGDAGFRYSTLKIGGAEVAGIGELDSSFPAEVPAHWSVYFAVEDTDAAVAKVNTLGGATEPPPGTPRTDGWPWSLTTTVRRSP
jgi:hypothetical protein